MEKHVSLETAKKLKDHCWVEVCTWSYTQNNDGEFDLQPNLYCNEEIAHQWDKGRDIYPAPDIPELLDNLPKDLKKFNGEERYTDIGGELNIMLEEGIPTMPVCCVFYNWDKFPKVSNDELVEALAEIWVKLTEGEWE